jgi:uroporphyrinogen-III synthase
MTIADKTIVVTRAKEQATKLGGLLESGGAEVLYVPTVEVVAPASWSGVDDSIRRLAQGDFDWIAFTSANGVRRFLSRLGCMPGEVFKDAKVAAVGASTAAALKDGGVDPDLVPERYTAVDLAAALGSGEGQRILLPRAEVVPADMAEALRAGGWETHEVAAYRTVPVTPEGPDVAAVVSGRFDAVTFTSASTARAFTHNFSAAALGLRPEDPRDRVVACIGPVTAQASRQMGLRVDVVASEHTAAGLVESLAAALQPTAF